MITKRKQDIAARFPYMGRLRRSSLRGGLRVGVSLLLFLSGIAANAQRTLTLDECRQLAVSDNNQMAIARVEGDIAKSMRKSAKTMALPRVSAVLGYQHFGQSISLLNADQKDILSGLGTSVGEAASSTMQDLLTTLVAKQMITQDQAKSIGSLLAPEMGSVVSGLNGVGNNIVSALSPDTRNVYVGAITLMQPIYMGGAVTAANRMAKISEKIAATNLEQTRQNTLYDIDNAYWLVVQLSYKKQLAEDYAKLVRRLNSDVQKMISEGVATKADGLKVSVALNEADMTLLKIDDGVRLAKMLVCQKCGLPLSESITLADEAKEQTDFLAPADSEAATAGDEAEGSDRPELQLLAYAAEMSQQSTKMVQAMGRPQILATASLLVTNPTLNNGFEKKFGANWNVGVLARIPLWDWNDNDHKVNAARALTTIANLKLQEATELIALQIEQNKFKLSEAQKQLGIADKNIEKAEENMRCANLGFSEGVMTSTEVMAAQTAWMQAKNQQIDAQIEIVLANISLRKALGKL